MDGENVKFIFSERHKQNEIVIEATSDDKVAEGVIAVAVGSLKASNIGNAITSFRNYRVKFGILYFTNRIDWAANFGVVGWNVVWTTVKISLVVLPILGAVAYATADESSSDGCMRDWVRIESALLGYCSP